MSYPDNFVQDNRPQDSLNFLKTVVGEDSGLTKNGTDSDKENDHSSNMSVVTSTCTQEFSLNLPSATAKKDQPMDKGDAEMWDDFYSEEDFENMTKKDEAEAGVNHERTTLEKVEEEEEDDYVDVSNATDTLDSNNTKENNTDSKADEDDEDRKSRRKRKKKLFKRIRQPLSPNARTQTIGGSHPNLGEHSGNRSRSNSNQLETMSETSGSGRKLSRRKQVSRPRCAGPAPGGDRLEQKYQELEQLMLKPLQSPAVYVQQTRQQMLRLQNLGTQYHAAAHDHSGLPPTGQAAPRETGQVNGIVQIIEEDASHAYSTIRTVQTVNTINRNTRPKSAHPRRRPLSGQRQNRPQSAGQARSSASNSSEPSSVLSNINSNSATNTRGRRQDLKRSDSDNSRRKRQNGRSDSSASGGSHKRSDRSESGSKERDYASSLEDGSGRSRSSSASPGRAVSTMDTHLKNSSNPAMRQWLKEKDKEHRKQKLEERKKKRKERAEKQEEELKKQEFLKNAEEKVKEWMTQKRKEAWKAAKEERKRKKEEEKEFAERQQRQTDSLRGKMFTPIQRPEGKYEKDHKDSEEQQQQDNAITTPQPPASKFVYKRPVSGRVRLMKLQQERKEDSKKLEAKKKEMDKLLELEKARKMRVSYDQWLLNKREDDYAKRQKAAKQKALAQSDPELDRIVPEMARRRIENIKRGKKRIDTGDASINRSVNKSFGGGDFGEEEGRPSSSHSYRLEVSGDRKSLKQRPSSAKQTSSGGLWNPKQSKSPRRPQSANPRVQALMDNDTDSNQDNAFKLPFPPELGVPKYVAARQEKLFSEEVTSNASFVDGGSNSEVLLTDDLKEMPVTEDNEGEIQEVGEVDGLSQHSQAVSDCADGSHVDAKTDEAGKGSEEDQSFFVTHGNLHEENEESVQENEEEGAFEDRTDTSDSQGSQTQTEKFAEEEETLIDDITKGIDEKDEDQSGIDEDETSNLVPRLEIGDDVEIDDEEEDKEEDQEKMDITDTGDIDDGKNLDDATFFDDTEKLSSTRDAKGITKHVSFSKEATIHEDPLAGISNDYEYFDVEDEDAETGQDESDKNEDLMNGVSMSESYDYEDLDEIEGYQDEDDEAEDERGGDFGSQTPRDDDDF